MKCIAHRLTPFVLSVLLASQVDPAAAQPTEATPASRFYLQGNVGYTSYDLSEVKDFYDDVLMVYIEGGIDMPTQKKYEPNVVVGLAGLYTLPKIMDVGLGSQYSKATALSWYEDFAGSVKVKSNVSFVTLEGIVQRDFPSQTKYNFYASVRGGLAFINALYRHDIVFHDFPDQNGFINLSGSGTGYTAEGMIGIKRSFKNLDIRLTAGYRQTSVDKLDATLETIDENTIRDTMEVKHDLSGFALNAVIAYHF